MRFRIGVDARLLARKERRGVARYEEELLRSLAGLNPEIDFILLSDTPIANDLIPDERLAARVYPIQKGWRFNSWLQAVLPYASRRERLDLLWCPANELPYFQPVPCVVTVHDAKILARQETILGRHYADGGRLMPRALLKAKRILTISEFTRREIQRLVECPESVIKVVHLGVSSAYRPPADKGSAAADLSIRHQISGEFCLAFGASAPYKNTRTLVRVFSRLLASGATRTQLVVIGNDGGFSDELRHIAQQEGGAQGIRLLGYVPFEDSLMFLGCARFFVYPSLYEGFGFPPLEAMACGTPVLAADSSSIPEVAGPGAMLYEAQSPEGLSSGILKMDELCEDIARRECATHVGMCHAARFTWDRTAQETLETLLRALGTR